MFSSANKKHLSIRLKKIHAFALDLLFPKTCINCGKEGFYICQNCFEKIELNKFSACYVCNRHTLDNYVCQECKSKTKLTGMLVASQWENELLRQLIYEYKYRFIKEISKPLSQILINYIKMTNKRLLNIDNLFISFVPLHTKRAHWRGFNQAELLAKELCNRLNIPFGSLLTRHKNTSPQAEMKKQKDRQKNIDQAFSLIRNPPVLKDKNVLLIDDICTTGATLEECAKALKPLKPKEVWGLVLARG